MKFVFFDTEFTGFADPKIMSIGCVDESGDKVFYCETIDAWRMKDCSDFVKTDVIPLFSGGFFAKSLSETATKLNEWIGSFDEPVSLVTDAPSWDWKMFLSIFERSKKPLPSNMVNYPLLLREVYPDLSEISQEDWDKALESPHPKGYRRHHALDDAMVNRLRWFEGYGEIFDGKTNAEFKFSAHPSETLKRRMK